MGRLTDTLRTGMQNNKTIKIFLGSSITELKDERKEITAHITNDITNLFGLGKIAIQFEVCEDIHRGHTGDLTDQDKIDNLLRGCDISVFLIKEKAGDKTVHEYDVAKEWQKEKPEHEIYVYFLKTEDGKKSKSVKAFQKRLMEEDFYWNDCDGLGDVKYDLLNGLLKRLGYKGSSEMAERIAQTAEARFEQFEKNEEQHKQKQAPLKDELHKDIEDLLAQIEDIWSKEDTLITARIAQILVIFRKTDRWAAATAYDKKKYSKLLYNYADFLYKYGLYKDSEAIYLRQISLVEELHGKESEEAAISYNNIGLVYHEQGNYGKALEYYFKALVIMEKILSMVHPDIAASYNNIGGVYHEKGDYGKALEYYFKALAIWEKISGAEYPYIATSFNNIGGVYGELGDYDKALKYHFKALAIMEKVLGIGHSNTSNSYICIGWVYYYKGDYDKALEYFFKDLTIVEKNLGPEHPFVATLYNNIGAVYMQQGDYDKALEYYETALAIYEKVLSTEHPDIATSYNNISEAYWKRGDYNKAIEYLFKALTLLEKVCGEEHPKTATFYNNIGCVYYNKGDYLKALEYLNKAYQIRLKVLGPEHPDIKNTLEWIKLVKKAAKGNQKQEKKTFWQRLFGK